MVMRQSRREEKDSDGNKSESRRNGRGYCDDDDEVSLLLCVGC
jgi:hypothetical protein